MACSTDAPSWSERSWMDSFRKMLSMNREINGVVHTAPMWSHYWECKFQLRTSALQLCREAGFLVEKALWTTYSNSEHRVKHGIQFRLVQSIRTVKRALFTSPRLRGIAENSGEVAVSTVSEGTRQMVQRIDSSFCMSRYTSGGTCQRQGKGLQSQSRQGEWQRYSSVPSGKR